MLFLLFGSSGAGKTTVLNVLRGRDNRLAVHDFDEIGVPAGADIAWRQRENERWLRRALDYQAGGSDLLIAGQTPFGEMLAAPSACRIDAISACLLDVDDQTRTTRLQARGPAWLAQTNGKLADYLHWAVWMRAHAADPSWRTDVIHHPGSEQTMCWDRWSDWEAGDRRWRVEVIDGSTLTVTEVAGALADWIELERALHESGAHPLATWAEGVRLSEADLR